MTTRAKEILRWLAIAGFGGFALYISVYLGYYVVTQFHFDWAMGTFGLAILIIFTSPFYAVAYICFRRKYRQLFKVAGVVGAIFVFGEINSLLRRWHLELHPVEPSDSALAALGHVAVGLLITLSPLFAAACVYRFCNRLAGRPDPTPRELSKANE
jgi:hypothetical protein